MKQLLYSLLASLLTCSAMAQITITAPPPVPVNVLDSASLPLSIANLPSMAPSSGGSWDLDSLSIQAAVHTSSYTPPTSSFSIASFADSLTYTLSAIARIGYKAWRNYQQSSTGIQIA